MRRERGVDCWPARAFHSLANAWSKRHAQKNLAGLVRSRETVRGATRGWSLRENALRLAEQDHRNGLSGARRPAEVPPTHSPQQLACSGLANVDSATPARRAAISSPPRSYNDKGLTRPSDDPPSDQRHRYWPIVPRVRRVTRIIPRQPNVSLGHDEHPLPHPPSLEPTLLVPPPLPTRVNTDRVPLESYHALEDLVRRIGGGDGGHEGASLERRELEEEAGLEDEVAF